MALADTIFAAQTKKEKPLTREIAQQVVAQNTNLWKELGLTPEGSPIGPKRPQDNFRIVNNVLQKGLGK